MSAAAHTPGPWRVDPAQDIDIQSANGKIEIAVALSQSLDGVRFTFAGKMPSKKTTLANARLIAAAPDLLAALQMLHEIDDDYGIDLTEQQRDQMHDALAKAEGRT